MIDTHCHLEKKEYENINEIIKHMDGNIMIASAYNVETIKEVLDLIDNYDNIYGTIGIHPEEISDMNEETLSFLESCLSNEKIVGIGEIGLDYHYSKDNVDIQKEYFIKQIELANKYNLPIVIHSRDAAMDTLEILKKFPNIKKDMHCYSYTKEIAKELKKINCKFGIGGVVTFTNGIKLREVVDYLDIEDILLETDSPYLSPFRGKTNEPYNIIYVAKEIANIKNLSVDEVLFKTTQNAKELFNIK